MKETFLELLTYLKNPVLEQDENTDFSYRFKKLLHLLLFSIITGFLVMPLFAIIEQTGLINMEDHAMDDLLKKYPKYVIFLLIAIVAPLTEELIFRAPLTLFHRKNQFKFVFYLFALIFGYVHITNYTMTTNVLLLSPILVLPQILLGTYLGFIRIRFGLIWSIALHAFYNGFIGLIAFSTDTI